MKILLSGSSGLIGRPLSRFLRAAGYEVVPLVRRAQEGSLFWDPSTTLIDLKDFEGFDAVIHLAGENIASRWTQAKKERLVQSRCRDTAVLTQILARLNTPPKIMLCASAIGFYGDRGAEVLTEQSGRGKGFLADLCVEWEAATKALELQMTVVHLRFGPVLSPDGGALKRMLPAFRWGLGGKLGSGKQFFSWVALEDVIGAIGHCLATPTLSGPVNVVAPHAVTQAAFAISLAKALHRPAFFSVPAPVLRFFLGQMGEELLLASARVIPQRLLETGYEFRQPLIGAYFKQLF